MPTEETVFSPPPRLPTLAANLVSVRIGAAGGAPFPTDLDALARWSHGGYTEPQLARAIWRTMEQLGFDGGRVLEPGGGAGAFTAMAPPWAEVTRVELDARNARRARRLYPGAVVRWESFAATSLPDGSFDAVAGNFSHSPLHLHDPVHNRPGHPLHDHFLLKSLALARPGGLVAAVYRGAQVPAALTRSADLLLSSRRPDGSTVLIVRRRGRGTATCLTETLETVADSPTGVGENGDLLDAYRGALCALGDRRCAELLEAAAGLRHDGQDVESRRAAAGRALRRLDPAAPDEWTDADLATVAGWLAAERAEGQVRRSLAVA